jgi:hypothetical protein
VKRLEATCSENRSFRVVLGEEMSRKMYIENGVVQGAVVSVTLFLVAMSEITNQDRQPVEIVGYADVSAIFTSDRDMETSNHLTRQKGFNISPEKTVCI